MPQLNNSGRDYYCTATEIYTKTETHGYYIAWNEDTGARLIMVEDELG
jgi:hypothetical protein